MPTLHNVCVFCGSSAGASPAYADGARALGRALVARSCTLVYGGGTVGLMGVVAKEVAAGAGPHAVLGFIPAALAPREISSELIGDTRVVGDMHERKAAMARAADGFVALPGGLGTLEELLEVMTWQQLGFHAKPVALLNTGGFYDPLLRFFRHCVDEGFVQQRHQNLIVDDDPEALLERMEGWLPPSSSLLADAAARLAALGEDISGLPAGDDGDDGKVPAAAAAGTGEEEEEEAAGNKP